MWQQCCAKPRPLIPSSPWWKSRKKNYPHSLKYRGSRMSEAATNSMPGRIYTFYSYKGGVGRSMALANIGVLLALAGKRVLLVDWDLEAPGLELYFSSGGRLVGDR